MPRPAGGRTPAQYLREIAVSCRQYHDSFYLRSQKDMHGWTPECEELLAEWSEKASCFRWLHARCEKRYRLRYYAFSVRARVAVLCNE